MSKIKVFLVEDEQCFVETLQEIIELNGFDTMVAFDGLEALAKCVEFMPDIILCDIMMPRMDGYSFFNEFRETISSETPFIFLTAKSEYSDIRKGMSLGADDYLVKPVKGIEVINAIKTRLLRQKQILSPELKRVERLEHAIGLITMHEFKNPLTGIIGFLDLIKVNIDTIDKENLKEYLSYIEQAAYRIINLLTKVTTWYQMQKNDNQLVENSSRSELSGIVEQIAQEIAIKYHRLNDLTLQMKVNPLIELSPELIKACFSELIDNAFKFSSQGDFVHISVSSEKSTCVVKLADNGNRTNATELMEYEPFTQFGKKVFEQQGLGIGINIARSIADLVKGEVEFLNNNPRGIITKVSIPLNQ